jgi:hypothetical protein
VSARSRVTDTPAPIRTLGPRGLRSDHRFTRGAEGRPPPATTRGACTSRNAGKAKDLSQAVRVRGCGGEIRPAGHRSDCAGACGSRAARPAGGDAGPDRGSCVREGNSEGPHAGLCQLGRTRRWVGGLGSRPSPSDRPAPAGQEKNPPRSGKEKRASHLATAALVGGRAARVSPRAPPSRDLRVQNPSYALTFAAEMRAST